MQNIFMVKLLCIIYVFQPERHLGMKSLGMFRIPKMFERGRGEKQEVARPNHQTKVVFLRSSYQPPTTFQP